MAALNTVSEPLPPIVTLSRFSYAYPGASRWTLRDISLRIRPGECHLIAGPTGAGKSTLLLAIRNLVPPGRQGGDIWLGDAPPPGRMPGLVMQNPRTQLLAATLGADVAFGLENHGVAPETMPDQVQQALDAVALRRPFCLPVDALSMGQQYRACLAGILVMHPRLAMLDEPMAQLDPAGREKILSIIRTLKNTGRAVLICDHRPEMLAPVVDYAWQLNGSGRLSAIAARRRPFESIGGEPPAQIRTVAPSSGHPRDFVCQVDGPRFSKATAELDLSALSFQVFRGERVIISGPNGSGKTTLVRSLAGLVRPASGAVTVFGASPRAGHLRGRVTLLFQDPAKQLFETTVFDEVAFAARRSNTPKDQLVSQVNGILERLGLSDLADASPHRLSYGQRHMVGLAAVLAGSPEILLLDDPFAGLDAARVRMVMHQVAWLAVERGTTVIWTTHDPQGLNVWADRVIDLSEIVRKNGAALDAAVPSEATIMAVPAIRQGPLPTGPMLILCLLMSMAAFAARTPALLAGLTAINGVLLAISSHSPLRFLRKSAIVLFWQAGLIMLLYGIRFGMTAGLAPGFRVAWQLFLAFWPGMIFMSANTQPRIVGALSRVLPQQTAFVMATCMRFLPLLLSEMQQIREAQILRGARILAADLATPRYWPDWFHCLLVPTLIKTLALVGDLATAAHARDFGILPRRTVWPGDGSE